MRTVAQRWQPIEALSEKMMGLAREGEWEEIPAIELERRALLESFFNTPVSAEEAPEVAERIRDLLAQDKEMMGMGTEASSQLVSKLNTFATGRKAQQAYAKHA